MDVGVLAGWLRQADIQKYTLSSVSFVPSGGGVCLQKYLKVRQERVSRGGDSLLCYDNKEQTFSIPKPVLNMRTYVMATYGMCYCDTVTKLFDFFLLT